MHCSHAKSDTTPCVLRDGDMCFAMDSRDDPICVGCERTPDQIGVAAPKDWAKTVADFKAAQIGSRRRR
jgi:predicted Fe-S protein YdhL (DUF1289 family)